MLTMASGRSISEDVDVLSGNVKVTLSWNWEDTDKGILTICPDTTAPINAVKIEVAAGECENIGRSLVMLEQVIQLDADQIADAAETQP